MRKMRLTHVAPAHIASLLRFWHGLRAIPVAEITAEADRPFQIAIVGDDRPTALLKERLSREASDTAGETAAAPAASLGGAASDMGACVTGYADRAGVPASAIVLDANALSSDEDALARTLAQAVIDNPELRLSIARRVPAFRPAVVSLLISETSLRNGKIALVSALPGIVPFTDLLMPAASLGDIIVLTRNQGLLLLRIAAAYGKEIDLRARTRELLPIVGSAFGWRALARELTGLVPGGIGVIVKASIAYAGTYTVGKAAAIYYSSGQILPAARLKQLYRAALRDAGAQVRAMLSRYRGKGKKRPLTPPLVVSARPVA